MSIGKKIKKKRLELGLSVEDVATKLGKNRATIYRYENDDIENLPTTVLEPLAQVLQTSPAQLMGWDNSAEHKYYSDEAEYHFESILDSAGLSKEMIILSRAVRKMPPEKRKQLLEVAKVMFKEYFRDEDITEITNMNSDSSCKLKNKIKNNEEHLTLKAAHNDDGSEEEQELMKQDLDEL